MNSPKSRTFLLGLSAACFVSCLWQTPAFAAETINLASGQSAGVPGSPGNSDDLVNYYTENTGGTSLATVFDTEFAAALSGPSAKVIAPVGVWLPGLTLGDPDARWINVYSDPAFNDFGMPSVSALYAAPFTVTTPGTSLAQLTVYFAADDAAGDSTYGGPNPEGLYLNGTPLLASGPGGYGIETVYSATVSVSQGANAFYIYGRDQGQGVSGVIFSATISIVPEPTTAALIMFGVFGLSAGRRRKRSA